VKHKDMMFNPRYGVVGLVAFPFYALGEMLAPVIEGLGYIVLLASLVIGAIDYPFAVAFLGVSIGYAFLLSLWAVVLEEISFRRYSTKRDLLKLLWFAVIESFGYRQLTLWFRLCAFPRYLRGDMRWGVMTREGPRAPAHPATTTPT
jgi:hypothetical protein